MENIRKIPGVNTWEAISGFRRAGFLDYVGELWQKYGDVFQINVFNRRMVVAMHPEAVRHVISKIARITTSCKVMMWFESL